MKGNVVRRASTVILGLVFGMLPNMAQDADQKVWVTLGRDTWSDHDSWSADGYPVAFPFEAHFENYNSHLHSQNDTPDGFGISADRAMNFAKTAAVYLAETAKGNHGNTSLLSTLPVQGRIPHITGEAGNFITEIILVNTDSADRTYSLTPFDTNGAEGPAWNGVIPAGTTERFISDQLFDTHPAHLSVETEYGVLVSVAYRATTPGSSPAHLYQSQVQSSIWRLLPGDWSVVWDGFAAVNAGAVPTQVHVRQIGEIGEVLATETVTDELAPNAKALYVLRDHFEPQSDCHYVIEAAQPLALTALRGNLGSQLLWVNPAVPVQSDPALRATYQVTFQSDWSAQTHPEDFPANPHFSGLIGATHHAGVSFWQEGAFASDGIESMAETGGKQALTSEIEAAIADGEAEKVLSGAGMPVSPGTVTLTFEIGESHPLVTLVSMVAPSPDWFVGVAGLRLFENGEWLQQKTVDLYVFDSGTDSGASYSAPNEETQPPEPIFRIPTTPFLQGNKTPAIGTFTFTKM